jgi:hypothetical protein
MVVETAGLTAVELAGGRWRRRQAGLETAGWMAGGDGRLDGGWRRSKTAEQVVELTAVEQWRRSGWRQWRRLSMVGARGWRRQLEAGGDGWQQWAGEEVTEHGCADVCSGEETARL